MLLESLPGSWEKLVVILGNAKPNRKHISLETLKSNLVNEEANWKDKESAINPKGLSHMR